VTNASTIEKSESLLIRKVPFSNTSHVVTWLTPEHGKLVTLVKGACRPRSEFLGQYDIGYTCELLFYSRETNGVHIARECTPLNIRAPLRSNWRAAACGLYLCDLLSRISVAGPQQPGIYSLAMAALDFICTHPPRLQVLFWFELHLLGALGLTPRLDGCSICSRSMPAPRGEDGPCPDARTGWSFSAEHGGLVCASCARADLSPGAHEIRHAAPDVIAVLRRWQLSRSPLAAQNTRCSQSQFLAFRELLGIFLTFHLEIGQAPRLLVAEMLRRPQERIPWPNRKEECRTMLT
jgi:DNA repair protein RecO (recombination protein O)